MSRPLVISILLLFCDQVISQDVAPRDEIKQEYAKEIVDAMASKNAAPLHVGKLHLPVFDPSFDWNEYERTWNAIGKAAENAEVIWPHLVAALNDERYSVTFESVNEYCYDFTVGEACQHLIIKSLTVAYANKMATKSKEAYYFFRSVSFLRDPKDLKQWCGDRKDKKLYEIQIEICNLVQTELSKPGTLSFEEKSNKVRWAKILEDTSVELNTSKKAALIGFPTFGKFGSPRSYTQSKAKEIAENRNGRPLEVPKK